MASESATPHAYLCEIASFPSLSPDDERHLGHQIQQHGQAFHVTGYQEPAVEADLFTSLRDEGKGRRTTRKTRKGIAGRPLDSGALHPLRQHSVLPGYLN